MERKSMLRWGRYVIVSLLLVCMCLTGLNLMKPVAVFAEDRDVSCIPQGIYDDPYIVYMTWQGKDIDLSKKEEKTEFILSNDQTVDVYFSDNLKKYAKDETLIGILNKEMERQLQDPDSRVNHQCSVAVTIFEKVGSDVEKALKKCYEKDQSAAFYCLFSQIDSAEQEEYIAKAYKNDKINIFLSSRAGFTDRIVSEYAKKAYEDNKVFYFDAVANKLSSKEIKSYAKLAYKDNKEDFFEICTYFMSEKQIESYMKQAYKEQNSKVLTKLAYCMTDKKIGTYLDKAYEDGYWELFQLWKNRMTEDQRTEYTDRAKKDNLTDKLLIQ